LIIEADLGRRNPTPSPTRSPSTLKIIGEVKLPGVPVYI
jgi:hypothetical protein